MANTTYVFSAYPDGNTDISTCTFSAINANKRTNIVQNNNKGIFVGSTKAKAIYKGNVQIWPEVKTLTFKNMTIDLPSVSLPKTVAVEHLLFFNTGGGQNYYMDAWSWGSDLVKEGNTYYFKAQNYAQPVMVCDVYFENTSNQVPLTTGNIITLNGSNIQMEWCTYDNIKVSCSPALSDLGTHFCYLKGVNGKAKLYLSCGAMANAYIKNPYTNEISLLSQCLPLEIPVNATISRSSQDSSFSLYSGSNKGIETNITVNGVSGRTILKRYPLYFGFVNQPADSSSSTPYTSYILEDENNIAYIPFRYVFNGCSWNPSCVSYTIQRKVLFNNGNNLTFWVGDARNSDTEISTPTYIFNQLDNTTNGILTTSMAFLCLSKNYTLNRTLYSGSSGSSPKKTWAIQTNSWYLEWYKSYRQPGLPDRAGTITGNIGLTGNVPISYTITNQRYLASNNHNTAANQILTSLTGTEYWMYSAGLGNDSTIALRSWETSWIWLPTQATNGPDCKYNLNVNLTMNIGCHGGQSIGQRWIEPGSNYFRFHVHVIDYNNNEIGWIQGNYNLVPHMVGGYSNDGGWYNFSVPLNDCNIIIDRSKNEEIGDRRIKLKIELDSNDFNSFKIKWGNGSNQFFLFKDKCRLVLTNISNINIYKVPLALNTTINFSSPITYNSLHFIKKTSSESAFTVTNTYGTTNENGNNLISVLSIKENSSNLIQQDPVEPTSIYGFSYYETISDTVNIIYSYYNIRKLRQLNGRSDNLLSHNGSQPLYHVYDDDEKYMIRLQTSENSKSINAETFISSVTRNYILK